MKTLKLSRFTCTLLESQSDIIKMPLRGNLFGINNRIYANLGSVEIPRSNLKEYKKKFSAQELEYPMLNRLFEVYISCRTIDDEYETIKEIDFKPLFDKIEKDFETYESVYANYGYDDIYVSIPLNSNILRAGCNYAYNIIEQIKVDNIMFDLKPKPLNNFLSIF